MDNKRVNAIVSMIAIMFGKLNVSPEEGREACQFIIDFVNKKTETKTAIGFSVPKNRVH